MISFILQETSDFLLASIGITDPETPTELLDILRHLFMPTLDEMSWTAYTLRSMVNLCIVAITLPIAPIGSALLYFDLRIRKEGFGTEPKVIN